MHCQNEKQNQLRLETGGIAQVATVRQAGRQAGWQTPTATKTLRRQVKLSTFLWHSIFSTLGNVWYLVWHSTLDVLGNNVSQLKSSSNRDTRVFVKKIHTINRTQRTILLAYCNYKSF